jgi:hypothetical protein
MKIRFYPKEYLLIPQDYETGVDNKSEKALMLNQD